MSKLDFGADQIMSEIHGDGKHSTEVRLLLALAIIGAELRKINNWGIAEKDNR